MPAETDPAAAKPAPTAPAPARAKRVITNDPALLDGAAHGFKDGPTSGSTGMGDAEYTAERLDLPSRGLVYPANSPLRAGSIMVRPITTKEEEILVTERLQRQGIALDMIMSRCIVTKGINTLEMLSGDRMHLLMYLRAISYGPEYQFRVKMPSTDTMQDIRTDVGKLKIRTLPDDFEEPYDVHVMGTHYQCRLSRGKDEQGIIQARLRNKKKFASSATEIGGTESLKQLIVSVDGDEDREAIDKHVEHMIGGKASRLRSAIAAVTPGPIMDLEVTNEESGELETISFQITEGFFRAAPEPDRPLGES